MDPKADRAVARALLAVALHIQAEIERAGLLASDAPVVMLDAVERWCERAVTRDVVLAMCREQRWILAGYDKIKRHDERAMLSFHSLARDLCYYVGSPQKTARSVYATVVHVSAQLCLQHLGEPLDAAKSRVQALYDAALMEARETQAQEARTWAPHGLDRGQRSDS